MSVQNMTAEEAQIKDLVQLSPEDMLKMQNIGDTGSLQCRRHYWRIGSLPTPRSGCKESFYSRLFSPFAPDYKERC